MCLFEIVDMVLLSKILFLNVMLFLSKIKIVSIVSIVFNPHASKRCFWPPASVVFKDNRDNRDNSWRKKCAYLKSLNVMLFLSKIKNCPYCLYCL